MCVCVYTFGHTQLAPRLILVGDTVGLMAAFLGLNRVYLIHVIDIPTHTHTHTCAELMSSLRASAMEADWWPMLQTDPQSSLQSFSLINVTLNVIHLNVNQK